MINILLAGILIGIMIWCLYLLWSTSLLEWYSWFVNEGADVQFTRGAMYASGSGVTRNYTKAAKWYRIAAIRGHIGAQFCLGAMYYIGRGVPQNYFEAAKWARMSAEQGDTEAQCMMGLMYRDGNGVSQNLIESNMWFTLSAANGNELAIKNRNILTYKMTSEQIAEVRDMVSKWRVKTLEN